MTISEILLQDYDSEISNTRRTLERVPEGKNDWAPHEKSMQLGVYLRLNDIPVPALYGPCADEQWAPK